MNQQKKIYIKKYALYFFYQYFVQKDKKNFFLEFLKKLFDKNVILSYKNIILVFFLGKKKSYKYISKYFFNYINLKSKSKNILLKLLLIYILI